MHEQFLLAALQQAWKGRGFCAPNPSVGAVAVQNETIIAQAFHQRAGSPHAEQLVLANLPPGLPDITLYVTLEPCNHWGRTPPCVDAIIAYGIKKVVYAYSDPNLLVAKNNTPEILRAKGIEVIFHPLEEITQFYASYDYWTMTKRPWVTVKIAQTLDGKIAGVNGMREQISNASCAQFTHQKRLQSDIILTTAKTINCDDPLLNVRLDGEETAKPIAIIDRLGILNSNAKVLTKSSRCLHYIAPNAQVKNLTNSTTYQLPLVNKYLDLNALFLHLGELGFHDVWVEAGAGLFAALHQAQLVQKTYIYVAPKILGQNATSLDHSFDFFSRPYKIEWLEKDDNMIASIDWI